jgi:ABC-2 type transport system permease protein
MKLPGAIAVVVESARQTLVLLLQHRLLWLVLLAEVVFTFLALMVGRDDHREMSGRHMYSMLTWWLMMQALMPWVTMFFGIQAVHGDIEERTFQYLFLRPVPRAAVLVGKWLAVSVLGAGIVALGVTTMFLAMSRRDDLWVDGVEWNLLGAFAIAGAFGAPAYAAVAAFFSARFKWPLVWSAVFIVGLQYFIGNLPAKASIRVITVADPIRRLLLDRIDPDRRTARWMWPTEREFNPDLIGQPELNLAIITLVALLLAAYYYTRTEYDSRARE